MKNNDRITILLNTTDSFADCWQPFFILFKEYWPEFEGKIYLNSESRSFSFPDLKIRCLTSKEKEKLSWSGCLKYALQNIEEEIILYMQEDYFINGKVDNKLINYFFKIIESDPKIGVVHLTDQAAAGPFEQTSNLDIVKTNKNTSYLASTQAAFWRKNLLLKLISKNETPWQFEHYGTKRARLFNTGYDFYNVNPALYGINKKEIISYIFTGIIKNKWNPAVVPLFKLHNISINFFLRGFISDQNKSNHILSTEYIKRQMKRIISELNILRVRLFRK
jgi:hypothetical protein